MDLLLQRFESEVRKAIPGFQVLYKDQSKTQQLLGFFARPFNPMYMTNYITTFYPVVYFPSKAHYEATPRGSFTTLAHEYIHLLDTKANPIGFRLAYIFPQVLCPLVLVLYSITVHNPWPVVASVLGMLISLFLARFSVKAFAVGAVATVLVASTLAVLLTKCWALLFFAGLALLAPWPSPGRVWAEKRGYAMTLAVTYWMIGAVSTLQKEMTVRYFTGPNYYFMSWRRSDIEAWVEDTLRRAQSGDLQKEPGYSTVYAFMKENELLRV